MSKFALSGPDGKRSLLSATTPIKSRLSRRHARLRAGSCGSPAPRAYGEQRFGRRNRGRTPRRWTLVVFYSAVLPEAALAPPLALARARRGQPSSPRQAGGATAPRRQDGLRTIRREPHPEEQHAKMMERLDEMADGPKQQKPGEGRKTNNAKAFSNSRHPDKIHARHLQRRHHCERVIQARKDALDLAKKIEDKYRHR